jgi:hypothetical protein
MASDMALLTRGSPFVEENTILPIFEIQEEKNGSGHEGLVVDGLLLTG